MFEKDSWGTKLLLANYRDKFRGKLVKYISRDGLRVQTSTQYDLKFFENICLGVCVDVEFLNDNSHNIIVFVVRLDGRLTTHNIDYIELV